MLEAIQSKFPDVVANDDLQWPMITQNGSPLPLSRQKNKRTAGSLGWADGDDFSADDAHWKKYWDTVAKRYRSRTLDAKTLSTSQADRLPMNWTVVNISVTEDKSTMFISRQRARRQPIIFCLPLKGRRESEDDKHLTFDDAIKEFKEIIALNDESTKRAVNVNKHDKRARSDWWAGRSALDARLRMLLDNIEFCWLGAFKVRWVVGCLLM
jgi:separase